MNRRFFRPLIAAVGLVFCAQFASAAQPLPEAARLMKLRDAERYMLDVPGSSIQAGAARVAIRAPISKVRRVVRNFNNYSKIISKFDKSRVVGKSKKGTDVYLQVPILKGLSKIWAVVRIGEIKKVGNVEVIKGHMLKGNVKRLDVTWKLKPIDRHNTQVNLELHIIPKLPFPNSVIVGEVAYAADEAVTGVRNSSEKATKS